MAGRDISVTHEALGTVRVMATGGMMGEVVGRAASLCKKYDAGPREVYEKHLEEFKQLLTRSTKPASARTPAALEDLGENVARRAKITTSIDCDFPGGNVLVERIDGDHVYLRQDPRDTPVPWFYWYFRVRNAGGRTLRFHFTQGDVMTVRGPAVSTDGGKTWQWLGVGSVEGPSFCYAFPAAGGEVRFCLAMPYQEANLREFLARFRDNPNLKVEPLAVTRRGRTERASAAGPPRWQRETPGAVDLPPP